MPRLTAVLVNRRFQRLVRQNRFKKVQKVAIILLILIIISGHLTNTAEVQSKASCEFFMLVIIDSNCTRKPRKLTKYGDHGLSNWDIKYRLPIHIIS